MVLIETNFVEKTKIKRIVILSDKIATQEGIHINNKFSELKPFIDKENLNSQPDGFLGLIDNNCKNIIYFLNIENVDALFYGVETIEKIPNDLMINKIVIILM